LQALELGRAEDDRLRFELLLGLGDAQWKAEGSGASVETFLRALEIGRALNDPEAVAKAALGIAGPPEQVRSDFAQAEPLEEALRVLPEQDSILRANVLARLATSYPLSESERRGGHAREALEMARRLQDERTVALAIRASMIASWRPDNVEEELEMAAEALALGERANDKELTLFGHGWRGIHLLHAGDIAGMDVEIERVTELSSVLKQPFTEWSLSLWRATRAMLAGRLDEAESYAGGGLDIGQRAGNDVAMAGYVAQMTVVRWLQGRLEELEPVIAAAAQQLPDIPAFRCSLALLYAEAGRDEEAKRALNDLAPDRFSALTLDGFWLVAATRLSDACALLGDAHHASILYELLLPYEGRCIVSGGAASASGSTTRCLGALAAAVGRWDEAERHFNDALEQNERMGARPFVAMTMYNFASMLLRRAEPGDLERAHDLLDEALAIVRDVGMSGLEERITLLREQAPA